MFKIKDGREYDKFNPLNPEMTLDEMVDLVYHHKYGGPRETAGILGIGTAVLLTTPIGSFGRRNISFTPNGGLCLCTGTDNLWIASYVFCQRTLPIVNCIGQVAQTLPLKIGSQSRIQHPTFG